MSRMISQREARRLQREVARLREMVAAQRRFWVRDYPGGTHIDTIGVRTEEWYILKTARRLGHACVLVNHPDKVGEALVYALPHSKEDV